jgi:hypothetical protein
MTPKIPSRCPWLTRHRNPLAALTLLLALLPPLPGFAQAIPTTPQESALNNGSKEEAVKYYRELSQKLGILTPATIEAQATVTVLLTYLGYNGLTHNDIEFGSLDGLMAKPGGGSASILPVGRKVAFQGDTGLWFGRCNGCQRPADGKLQDTVTVHIPNPAGAPYAWFDVVDAGNGKVALKADTGNYIARCQGCIVGATYPNSLTVHVSGAAPPPAYAQFTPEKLANGKIALKADTGLYLARCRGCSPNAAYPDTVTIHSANPSQEPWAQWTLQIQGAPAPGTPGYGSSGTASPAPSPAMASLKPGEILVSRFFAPKIVNFAVAPAQREIGWRRLVRVNSRVGSVARQRGVESAWILFNHFTKPPAHKPFLNTPDTSSVNTQVALITNCAIAPAACKDAPLNSIYWLDFGGTVTEGGKLSYALNAFFDAGALANSGKSPGAPYFVPNGCDTCHGTLKGNAILNTLDTDHWMDRLTDGDFPALTAADAPAPLFDAGKDIKSAQYAAGFDVLRKLNEEINTEQQRVRPGGFHQKATSKWVELHKNSSDPVADLVLRAIEFSNTGHPLQRSRKAPLLPAQMWKPVAEDRELLGLLNKYCYRCHGAVRFDVYSKDMIADESSFILDRVDANATQQQIQGFKMPPDRDMPAKDKARLLELVDKLYNQTH